jgi:hypothetical protein
VSPLALTVAEGSLILVVVLLVGFVALAYGLYSRRGSGISQQPYGDIDHDSGPEMPSQLGPDTTEQMRNLGRGTAGHHGHRRRPPASG